MRVLHVVRQFRPSIGGFEDVVLNLCRELRAAHGIDARVVTLNRVFSEAASKQLLPSDDVIDGIPVKRIPYFGSSRYPLAPRIFRELGSTDLLHVHCIDFFFDALAAGKWLHGLPLVASTHGGFFHTPFAANLKRAYFSTVTRASSRAYATICASSENDHRIFKRIAPRNTVLVQNGVDVLKWRGAAPGTVRPTLIFIGRFSTNKRIEYLFPILRSLRGLDANWRIIVAGREYDRQIPELQRLADKDGVLEFVKFVEAPNDEECRRLIGTSSYFISASAHEGFGLSAVEALSAGLLPILSDIPPFRELVRRAGLGRIVEVTEPDAAARAIHALHLQHQTHSGEWRERAIRVADSYAWPDVAARFVEVYRRALNSAPSSRDAIGGIGMAEGER